MKININTTIVITRSRPGATWQSRTGLGILNYLSFVYSIVPFCARVSLFLFSAFILFSCAIRTLSSTPQLVSVYSTYAAQPWLSDLYACAVQSNNIAISRIDDLSSAEIVLRVGDPRILTSPAYQIDTEEILISTHRVSPVQNLTREEARILFAGHGDPSVQIWVYTSGEDVQEVFDQFVMEGRSVSSSARIAAHPQQMSDTLINEPNTVGILPRHWKVGDSRLVYSIPNIPVLAVTPNEPEGAIRALIACLQK